MSHLLNVEYVNIEQFKWHFPMNTWQKPMTQFVRYFRTMGRTINPLLEKNSLYQSQAGRSNKNAL